MQRKNKNNDAKRRNIITYKCMTKQQIKQEEEQQETNKVNKSYNY